MEYQKIINLLNNTTNQITEFRTKNCVEINDESRGKYKTNSQIRFKTSMLRASLCDYSDVYILIKGTIAVENTAAADAEANNTNKNVIFKHCVQFTCCICRINNPQIDDDAQYIDVVTSMYNLIEYSDNCSKTSGIVFHYCRDVPNVDKNGAVTDFTDANVTDSFNLKAKLTGQKMLK